MKAMPIAPILADEQYVYNSELDEWYVEKKSGSKKLSKKDIVGYEGGYESQSDAVYWGAAPVNTYSDQPMINHDAPTGLREGDNGEPILICPTCKSENIDKESSPAKCLDCGVDFIPKPDRGSDDPSVNDYSQNYFWGPNDLGRSHQNQPGANGWLPAGSEDMDGPSPNSRMSSLNKNADVPEEYWISPDGELHPVGESGHVYWIEYNPDTLENFDIDVNSVHEYQQKDEQVPEYELNKIYQQMLRGGWTRVGQSTLASDPTFYIEVGDIRKIPSYVDNYIPQWFEQGRSEIQVGDLGGHLISITDPFPSLQKAVNKALRQPKMSSFKSFMHKQSSLNKISHCGPCSVLKMEALHILIDLYYKDHNLFPEEIVEELSVIATELKIDNFNDILESVITEYLEEKSEEVGDKLPKLKNLLITLKDIAPKLGKEIPVVDKQANLKQADDRGQQEITQYDPEYQFLIKLINVVTKAGVPASEIKALSMQHPFVTINDAGDLAAQIWTLATTKYNIPREYLLSKLPKNASLNKQAERIELSSPDDVPFNVLVNPSHDEVFGALNHSESHELRYIMAGGDTFVWDAYYGTHDWTWEQLLLEGYGQGEHPEIGIIDNDKMVRSLFGSLDKQANPPSRFWIAPDGEEFVVAGIHPGWIRQNGNILRDYGIKPSKNSYFDMKDSGWVRVSNEPSGTGFQLEVKNLNTIPPYVDDFIAKYYKQGDKILIGDGFNKGVEITDPFPSIQKAVNKELGHSKQASLDEVLDQTTQDAIAAEYGVQYLIPLRFYQEALGYGQTPERAFAYALQEGKREQQIIDPKQLAELVETYF